PVAPGDSAGAEERTCHPRGEGRSNLRHPREECLRPRGGVPLPWPTFDTARAAALREMREDVSMSKHSTHATRTLKTSPLRRGLARTAVTLVGGAVVATGMIATGTAANAAGGWDEVAACESGGDWSINTGNGYYGGLQFSQQTWEGYGGTQYAATADQASKSQQIAIGEKVLAGQGAGAWPTCGTAVSGGADTGSAPSAEEQAPEQEAPEQEAPQQEQESTESRESEQKADRSSERENSEPQGDWSCDGDGIP